MSRSKVPLAMTPRSAATVFGQPSHVRHLLAVLLRAASDTLDRLAEQLALPATRHDPAAPAELEFYAQAGAPEGALYVDGQFVGWIQGVTRL